MDYFSKLPINMHYDQTMIFVLLVKIIIIIILLVIYEILQLINNFY